MRDYSLALRDYLILENVNLNNSSSVLEIGVGLGSFVNLIKDKVKEFSGVDISKEIIDYLFSLYKNNIDFYCLDVCKDNSNLNRSFDVIVSVDTLEHVTSPQKFFRFIKRHLKINGEAVVVFPNESKEKHHGIAWLESKRELLYMIGQEGLEIKELQELKEIRWHGAIKFLFWKIPKMILVKDKNPQTFEKTNAYQIISRSGSFKMNILSFYAKIIKRLASVSPSYKYFLVQEHIKNKRLFIKIKNGK